MKPFNLGDLDTVFFYSQESIKRGRLKALCLMTDKEIKWRLKRGQNDPSYSLKLRLKYRNILESWIKLSQEEKDMYILMHSLSERDNY